MGEKIRRKERILKRTEEERKKQLSSRRELKNAREKIDKLCQQLNLPVKDIVFNLYKEASAKRLTRGKKIELTIAALCYLACKQNNISISLKELAKAINEEPGKIYHKIEFYITGLKVKNPPVDNFNFYIEMITSKLGLSEKTKNDAKAFIEKYRSKFGSQLQKSLAAVAVYLVAINNDEPKSESEVANAVGITKATLKNGLRILRKLANKDKNLKQIFEKREKYLIPK